MWQKVKVWKIDVWIELFLSVKTFPQFQEKFAALSWCVRFENFLHFASKSSSLLLILCEQFKSADVRVMSTSASPAVCFAHSRILHRQTTF